MSNTIWSLDLATRRNLANKDAIRFGSVSHISSHGPPLSIIYLPCWMTWPARTSLCAFSLPIVCGPTSGPQWEVYQGWVGLAATPWWQGSLRSALLPMFKWSLLQTPIALFHGTQIWNFQPQNIPRPNSQLVSGLVVFTFSSEGSDFPHTSRSDGNTPYSGRCENERLPKLGRRLCVQGAPLRAVLLRNKRVLEESRRMQ